jgi:hypothetical protein
LLLVLLVLLVVVLVVLLLSGCIIRRCAAWLPQPCVIAHHSVQQPACVATKPAAAGCGCASRCRRCACR